MRETPRPVQAEVQRLVAKIRQLGGAPVVVRHLLSASVMNNILYYLVGTTYDLDDPRLEQMTRLVAAFSGVGLDFSLENLPTWMRKFAQHLQGDTSTISSDIQELTDYMR
ncbi:hypothetical protein HPB50_022620 [Hyalomma asiaticum]|uniref:Uncharacterized protein n=1 Tax=Hyalomma asiaticum TaxID=266040 RepID=A0ACB7RYI7_HYAAI|nr:hypothetical protein HPB50_022620 [Hyalomma asiaticum]